MTNPAIDGNEDLIFRDLKSDIKTTNVALVKSFVKIENIRQNNGE